MGSGRKGSLDRGFALCYNVFDNLITQCVAALAERAGAAEQDNRVKIPDGTAAVCADGVVDRRKPVTGGDSGKADHSAGAVPRKA